MGDLQQNKDLVQSFFDEVWNKGNFDYMDDIYTTDFQLNALWQNTSLGRSGAAAKNEARTTIEGWLDGFPDMHVTVEEQVADGDFVASRHIAIGTQAKEFRGLPNTGKRGAITGITINRVSGDRVAEVWTCWDAAGMMQQLGILPGPDPEISAEETAGIWAGFPELPDGGVDAKAVVSRLYDELWSQGSLELADELIDDGYLGHAPGRSLARGPEGIRKLAAEWREGVPDLKFEIHAQHAEGSRCVTRLTASGTHTGDWLGIPATGKVLSLSGISIARVAGGKVVSEWSEFDGMGLLGQLS
jgi:steroid delta-isomerase-like uncharacterized protein